VNFLSLLAVRSAGAGWTRDRFPSFRPSLLRLLLPVVCCSPSFIHQRKNQSRTSKVDAHARRCSLAPSILRPPTSNVFLVDGGDEVGRWERARVVVVVVVVGGDGGIVSWSGGGGGGGW